MTPIKKPLPREYPTKSQIYMDLIPSDEKVLCHLWGNFIAMKKFLEDLPEEILTFKKNAWNWSIKETIVHLMDDERIHVYRALRYSRNDETPLRDYDPEKFIMNSATNNRSIKSIFDEYETLRKSTISFFNNLSEDCFIKGRSDLRNYSYRTIRAIVYHIAGYQLEQFQSIKSNLLKHESV